MTKAKYMALDDLQTVWEDKMKPFVSKVFGASGTNHAPGLVPDPGSTQGNTKYLREDGTWAVPAGPDISGKADVATTLAGYGITDAYTKTEVNGLVDSPHQNYVTVEDYASLPATGSGDTIYRVANYDGENEQVDVTKYSEYAWNGTSYTFLDVKSQIGEVFDISEYNSSATYTDLANALGTNGANVPESIRRGGMSVKYVQRTSDNNKYVQYLLTKNNWSTDIKDWEKINNKEEVDSLEDILSETRRLVKTSTFDGFMMDGGDTQSSQLYAVDYYDVPANFTKLKFSSTFNASGTIHLVYYFNGEDYLGCDFLHNSGTSEYSGVLNIPANADIIAINRNADATTELLNTIGLYQGSIADDFEDLSGKVLKLLPTEQILQERNNVDVLSTIDNSVILDDNTIGSFNGYFVKYYEISDLSRTYYFNSRIQGSGLHVVHYYNGNTHLGYECQAVSGTLDYSGVLHIPEGTTKIAINTQSDYEVWYCDYYNGRLPDKVLDNSNRISALENVAGKKIKALFIGNSLNQDHSAYVPWLLKGLYPEVEFEIYICYIGGFTVKEYVTQVINGTHKVDIFSRAINTDVWTNETDYEYADIFTNFGPFDLISYQGFDIMPEMKEEDVADFPVFVQDLYTRQGDAPFRLAYNLIQNNRTTDASTKWQRNMACLDAALLTTPVDMVFPTGVVTELVRSDFGTSFITPDDLHNNQGLPCIMGAYAMVLQLIRYLGLPERILNNPMRITSAKETELNIPGVNGTLQIGTDAQYIEAQEAAIQAVKYIDAYCNNVVDILARETVQIVATADSGSVAESAVLKIKVNGSVVAQGTGSLSYALELDTEYTIEAERVYDYLTPAPQTFTAGQSVRTVTMAYTYIQRDTITIDQTETDELTMVSGDVQGDVIKAIRAASHLYLGTPLQDGSEFICQLSDIDGTKYFDGTNAALDGTEGDQWMKLPVFWWKRTAIGTAAEDGSHDSYSFSFAIAGEPDPSWHKWEGAKNLLGAKEMTVINGVGHSISGGQSTGSLTKAQFETAAAARSAGSICVTWEWQWMMCTLLYAWHGRMNSQMQCGTGSNSYTRTLGTKDALGMTDTTNSNGNSDNTKFWGIENWWGGKAEWIGRVTSNNYVLTILDMNTGQSRTVSGFIQCGGTGGWSSRMKITEDMDYIPVAKSGTETTSYCDWVNSNSGSRVVIRSDSYAGTYGGVACVYSHHAPSYSYASVGSRLAFNGVVTEAESVAAYKAALPVGQ